MIQRFSSVKPKTIGEAARIKGVTPAAVTAILGFLEITFKTLCLNFKNTAKKYVKYQKQKK